MKTSRQVSKFLQEHDEIPEVKIAHAILDELKKIPVSGIVSMRALNNIAKLAISLMNMHGNFDEWT